MDSKTFLRSFKRLLSRIAAEDAGFEITEYALLLGLVVIAAMVAMKTYGHASATRLMNFANNF